MSSAYRQACHQCVLNKWDFLKIYYSICLNHQQLLFSLGVSRGSEWCLLKVCLSSLAKAKLFFCDGSFILKVNCC